MRALLLFLSFGTSACLGQDFTPKELKNHFQTVAESYRFIAGDDKLKFRQSPIFFWTNNEREMLNGATYVWMRRGRPMVLASIFSYQWDGKTHCRHELLSLSAERITGSCAEDVVWTPARSEVAWKPLAHSPQPAESANRRSSQMRSLVRRFSGTLRITGKQPSELRLLPKPLLRYQSPDSKVIDGAIFALTVATDAEILVLIEAQGKNVSESVFKYAAAPGHYHSLELRLDDQKVWSAPTRLHLEQENYQSSEAYTILSSKIPLSASAN